MAIHTRPPKRTDGKKPKKKTFNGLFSRTTWVRQHQKGKKTILNFNETRDDGVAVASARPYANHLHLTTDI